MEYNREWEYGTPSDCDCENNFIQVDCGCKSKDVCECENILLEISKLKSEDIVLQREIDAISAITVSGVTEEQLNEAIASAKTEIEAEIPSLSGYATEQWVEDKHYITGVDLSDYATLDNLTAATDDMATQTWVNNQGYLTEHQSLSAYSTTEQMNEAISAATDGFATEEYVNAQISSQTSDFVTGEQLSSYTYDKATIDEKIPSMSGYVTLDEFGDYIMRLRSEIDTLRQQVSGCCEIPPTPTPTGDTDCVVRIKYTQGEDFVIPCEESYIGNLESFELPSPYTRPDATAVTVGNCTGQIGQACFEDFFQLQTVYISSACTSIRLEAFYGCSALTTVTIEATTPPTMAWNNTFQGCTSLQHIYVPAQSVNAYKTAQYWDTYANLIAPIV